MRAKARLFAVVFTLLLVPKTGLALLPYESATPPSCGVYTLHTWVHFGSPDTYSCQRAATFPWFTVQQGKWETQVSASAGKQGGARFQFILGKASTATTVWGGLWFNSGWGSAAFGLQEGGSDLLTIISAAKCTGFDCAQTPELATGTLDVRISAPDVASLEAASAQLVYFNHPEPNSTNWQVSVPLVFNDKAAVRWSTIFTETPKSLKGMNANNTAFAVANLADYPQVVRVSIYDTWGQLVVQKDTPELMAGARDDAHPDQMVHAGGVFTVVLADFIDSIPPGPLAGSNFRGRIRFEGLGGGKITPLVLRAVSDSLTSLQLKEEE